MTTPIPTGILFIFEVQPDGSQVLVHTETPASVLSYDELVAWQTHWEAQFTCGTYQFDYVTFPGILEALKGDESLANAELLKWQGLEVGKPATPDLAGTVWNGHYTDSGVCVDRLAPPIQTYTPVVEDDTPAQAIELNVHVPDNLTPLPTTPQETTTSVAPPPPVAIAGPTALATTGYGNLWMVWLAIALMLSGVVVKNLNKLPLDKLRIP